MVLGHRGVPGADELFGVEALHILDVTRDADIGCGQGLVVRDVESGADLTGCPDCGVIAVGHADTSRSCTTPRASARRCGCASGPGAAPDPRVVKGPGGARLRAAAGQASAG